MTTHEFVLHLSGRNFDEDSMEDFVSKVGTDCLFAVTIGQVMAYCDREAPTQGAAILEVVAQVQSIGFAVDAIEADPAGELSLYHWNRLKTCENYATGDGIVAARSIEEARATLREGLLAWARENRGHLYDLPGMEDERAEFEAKVAEDVASEPSTVEPLAQGSSASVIVRGSE